MKIVIKEEFIKDHMTREAGERLRELIVNSNEIVELDFSEVKVASVSFFDEGIAKLSLRNWDQKKIDSHLIIKNIYSMDQKLLEQICETRGIRIRSSIKN